MTGVVAGIDIGNSTTEVVLARLSGDAVEVVAAGRAPTRGTKGAPRSLDGAVALVRRLEREHGVHVGSAYAAPLRPVRSSTALLPEPASDTGRLRVVSAGASTPAGSGFGVGRPCRLGERPPDDGPLVAVVPAGFGYLAALAVLEQCLVDGRLAAVLLADDEAVLVANRLSAAVPVVDEIDVPAVLGASLVAVEVAAPGALLRELSDPLRLVSRLGLGADERPAAARVAGRLADVSNAVVAVDAAARPAAERSGGWADLHTADDVERLPLLEGHERIVGGDIGLARAFALPPDLLEQSVDDLWTVDLSAVADVVLARSAATGSRSMGLAALDSATSATDPGDGLTERLGVPVTSAASEAAAARAGALSTPGAGDAVVVDLGGGTLDVVAAGDAAVAAGAGQLLTAAVAALTGTSAAAAEWVKRGPAFRVEAPQVLLAEDGSRSFLDRPADPASIGSLVVSGPAGLLPFGSGAMSPGEWRALRLRLKVDLLGGNISRALRTLQLEPASVVVVGGPAGDDEVLSAVTRALPPGVAVGRGDVGGALGFRWAVAYGLVLLAREASNGA